MHKKESKSQKIAEIARNIPKKRQIHNNHRKAVHRTNRASIPATGHKRPFSSPSRIVKRLEHQHPNTLNFSKRLFDQSANNLPAPVWQSDPALGVRVTFQTGEVTEKVMRLLHVMTDSMKRSEIQHHLGLKHEEHFRRAYLLPAMEAALLEMTIPDKPRSRLQQYRPTRKGLQFLKQTEKS